MNERAIDSELVGRAADGDHDAFAAIVERHAGVIHAIALARTADADAADEVFQRTFVRAYTSLGSLRDPEKLCAWLCQIARTTAVDWHREQKVRPTVGELAEHAAVAPATELVDGPSRTEEVLDALDEAPEIYREPIALHYLQGLSYVEIAETLGLPRTTVRSRIYEGKRWLRRRLLTTRSEA